MGRRLRYTSGPNAGIQQRRRSKSRSAYYSICYFIFSSAHCQAQLCKFCSGLGYIFVRVDESHPAIDYHCHCEEGEARRSNLLEGRNDMAAEEDVLRSPRGRIRSISPGDSHGLRPRNDMTGAGQKGRKSYRFGSASAGSDSPLHISAGDGVPYGCISVRRNRPSTTTVIARRAKPDVAIS